MASSRKPGMPTDVCPRIVCQWLCASELCAPELCAPELRALWKCASELYVPQSFMCLRAMCASELCVAHLEREGVELLQGRDVAQCEVSYVDVVPHARACSTFFRRGNTATRRYRENTQTTVPRTAW